MITGIAMVIIGTINLGAFRTSNTVKRQLYMYLGLYFLILILAFQVPYTVVISPHKISHLGVWAATLKELAYSGGAFVLAGSFKTNQAEGRASRMALLEKLIPLGKVFFSTTMILFGCSHLVYVDFISPTVPSMFGMPVFWTYFGGVALICSGLCIILNLYRRVVALLLSAMLFLWFILLHVPNAVAHPFTDNGNEIVSAFDALLFCGVSLVIASAASAYTHAIPSGSHIRLDRSKI